MQTLNYYGSLVYGAITLAALMYFGISTDNHLVTVIVLWASACCWLSAYLGTAEERLMLFVSGLAAFFAITLIISALFVLVS